MKHTPGPWAEAPFEGHVSAGARLVAGCMGYSDNSRPGCREENIANARLIAAAPDLLAALKGILEYASSYQDSGPAPHGWRSDEQLSRLANASIAIAKAEGENL